MKTTKEKKTDAAKNWALPGQMISHKEFIEAIREAEKGPFYTAEELEKRFEEWKLKRLVVFSSEFENDLNQVYLYGVETFGKTAAEIFQKKYYLHFE